ncbi:MAG: hypothetical protein JRG91_18865 [Deltaproteobacteria bacterium]|nr:hypothetical protein [Deltaproteobacteria bacterium]
MRKSNRFIWAVAVLASALVMQVGCTEKDGNGDETDAATEPALDAVDETPADDPIEEPVEDPVEEPGCVYPEEPYSFESLGSTAGPAVWPTSVKGGIEISELEHADFEEFFCDETVQSIIVFFGTTT